MIKHFACLLALSSLLLLPGFALGQTNFTNGSADGTWGNAANWSAGLPSAGPQNANIGAFTVSLTTAQTSNELDLVGDQNTGTAVLNQTSGSLAGGGWIKVGIQSGTNGTYNLSGGATSSGWGEAFIGRGAVDAFGTLDVSGAGTSYSSNGRLWVGSEQGNGQLNISTGGSVGANGDIEFARSEGAGNGTADLQMSSGTLTAGGKITFGGPSTATISGGVVTASGGEISVNTTSVVNIGNATLTGNEIVVRENGTINQTAGTVTANNWISIGNNPGTSTYDISGGSLNLNSDWLTVGDNGAGILKVSGNASVTSTANGFIVGRNENNAGTLEITGSLANVSGTSLRVGINENGDVLNRTGSLSWIADANGISAISVDSTLFGTTANLLLDFSADANSLVLGTEYLLIDNAVSAATGTFTSLAEGATVNFGSGIGTISYVGGLDGLDVVVTVAVPEPSSIALLGLAVIGLASRRKRRS